MSTVKLTAVLIPEDEGGYTVYCPELDIYTQGETEPECLRNLREAAGLHTEELRELTEGPGGDSRLRQVIRREIEINA